MKVSASGVRGVAGVCRRVSQFIAVLAISTGLVAGCQVSSPGNRANTLVMALTSEPARLNPLFISDLNSFIVSGFVFNGLTRFDADLNVIPDLAESWQILKGGREIRFKLRQHVRWHDGNEFSADDVVFTYRAALSPRFASPRASQFGPVEDVQALDRHTVRVLYREPYGSALASWTLGILPVHAFKGRDMGNGAFDREPIGTGPYILESWTPGQNLVFRSHSGYFRGEPRIKKMVVKIVPDVSSRLLEARKGTLDVTEVGVSQYLSVGEKNGNVKGLVRYRTPSFRYAFLGFNLRYGPFKDRRVRQAISHAIDKEGIVRSVLRGLGSPSTGPYPPGVWYASTKAGSFRYDPSRAEKLLSDAGWRRDDKGAQMKAGRPFSFTLLTNYENEEHGKLAQIVQSDLKAIGIDVKIQQLEWQTFRHEVISKHHFDAVILSRAYIWDPDIFDLWHSSKTGEGEWNFLSYSSQEVDHLLERGRGTVDRETRAGIYRGIHERIAEDQPCVFLYDSDGLFLANKRVKGIRSSPLGIYNFLEGFSLSE
jgi:peptide/nickel transport system substrate-binding protein